MSDDDYLWDPRSRGPRDPLVERLERKLQARQLEPPRRGFRPLVVLPLAAAAVVLGLVGWQAYGRGDASRSPAGPQAFHAREAAPERSPVDPRALASQDPVDVGAAERRDTGAALAEAGPAVEDGVAADEDEVADPEVQVTPEEPIEEGAALTGR